MKKPFWVLENTGDTARTHLFTWMGVKWLATRRAWLSLAVYGFAGMMLALWLFDLSIHLSTWIACLGYGLLLYSTNIVHTLGHILSGHLVGSPMQGNLLTATFDVNLYLGDQSRYPRRVHIGRASGGPALNLLVGILSLALGRWLGWNWLMLAGIMHLATGFGTMLPIAPMDGWMIWNNLAGKN